MYDVNPDSNNALIKALALNHGQSDYQQILTSFVHILWTDKTTMIRYTACIQLISRTPSSRRTLHGGKRILPVNVC